jgi:hypothetical protein
MSAQGNTDEVARNFAQFYYQTFATNRPSLSALYQPHSLLTIEGTVVQGAADIVSRLSNLPPLNPASPFAIDTLDAQPSNAQGGLIIFVTGRLQIEGESNPLRFSQTFQLIPQGPGSYFVQNDIFRLNYG